MELGSRRQHNQDAMIVNLSQTASVADRFIAQLRNVSIQGDRLRFRRNLERLGEIFAYEISKTLAYQVQQVETPLGIATYQELTHGIVVGGILRAGLPLHQGLLQFFDDAENAFVSAYRKHHKDGTFEINLEYVSCPSLDGKVLILADPMLATGASMVVAVEALRAYGEPQSLHLVTAIASTAGLEYIQRLLPQAHVWMGALDDELTAKSYIVPGLGDAGDLAYGEKLQE